MIHCANCGGAGHVHKNCNHPITSYGIICFRASPVDGQPEYLMVQRKDSLAYVEFMRGKYSINQRQYIMHLFANMTETERQALLHTPFDRLWTDLWQVEGGRNFQREYGESRSKHELLKSGFLLRPAAGGSTVDVSKHEHEHQHEQAQAQETSLCHLDLQTIVQATSSTLAEPEWGFPKGRRNINEADLHCALREFREETGMHPRHLQLLKNQKPVEEVFSGSNHVRYRHVYYLAHAHAHAHGHAHTLSVNPVDHLKGHSHGHGHSNREIQSVQWFRYEDAQAHIRCSNVERKELFRRVHGYVLKMMKPAPARQLQQHDSAPA